MFTCIKLRTETLDHKVILFYFQSFFFVYLSIIVYSELSKNQIFFEIIDYQQTYVFVNLTFRKIFTCIMKKNCHTNRYSTRNVD